MLVMLLQFDNVKWTHVTYWELCSFISSGMKCPTRKTCCRQTSTRLREHVAVQRTRQTWPLWRDSAHTRNSTSSFYAPHPCDSISRVILMNRATTEMTSVKNIHAQEQLDGPNCSQCNIVYCSTHTGQLGHVSRRVLQLCGHVRVSNLRSETHCAGFLFT